MSGRLSLEEELEALIKDREEHIETKTAPALVQGQIVIFDRYFYSTIAYQGSRGVNIQELDEYVRRLVITPDVVLVLDIDPRISIGRINIRDGKTN